MRESTLELLRCPADMSKLELTASNGLEDGHILQGDLQCSSCGEMYPVKGGVPELLPRSSATVDGHDLGTLQEATVERFGWEWREYKNWGWLKELPETPGAEHSFYGALVENTRSAFWGKSLFDASDLGPGRLVLDAGCGNGRFTNQAAETGAEVIGIDLGWGVQSAFEHTRHLANVHIVRGDLFRLPFADASFDRVFSIGVLMHTGNAEAALSSLARTVRPEGLLLAHVYGKGRPTYEVLDAAIRSVSTRLSIKNQIRFSRLTAGIAHWLSRGGRVRNGVRRRAFSFVNILPTEHHMFDWWSAPIATHHTLDEVIGWFDSRGFEVVRTRPPRGDEEAERKRRYGHGAVTVLGRRTSSA